jgi:hypothetical protein
VQFNQNPLQIHTVYSSILDEDIALIHTKQAMSLVPKQLAFNPKK